MIKDLIVKLMEQANSEADHKAYCNTELATNKQTRENKQAEVDELSANSDKLTAQSAQLTKELKDFYAKAAGSSLLQAPYTGMQSEHGGIVGFLEVILSDFARLESETSSAEDQAAAAYEKFMDETNEDIAVKETEISHNEDNKEQ